MKCTIPPPGWACTREPGHKGSCAAWPTMTKHIFSKGPAPKLLRTEEAVPRCSYDFCQECSHCLGCMDYAERYCLYSDDLKHIWVVYE